MLQADAVRLERFWLRVNPLLQDLNPDQLQCVLDGMDLLWASTWGLLDTRLMLASAFPPLVLEQSAPGPQVKRELRQVQDRLRALARSCQDHPWALKNLTKTVQLLVILAGQDLDVTAALSKVVYEVDLTRFSLYQLLKACEFRSVAPEVLEYAHALVPSNRMGRYGFILAQSQYTGVLDTEAQMLDMGAVVASLAHLLHFARGHADLGDQSLNVVVPAAHWIRQSDSTQVTAFMTYQNGERHLGVVPTAQLNCSGQNVRILAWRKPGR